MWKPALRGHMRGHEVDPLQRLLPGLPNRVASGQDQRSGITPTARSNYCRSANARVRRTRTHRRRLLKMIRPIVHWKAIQGQHRRRGCLNRNQRERRASLFAGPVKRSGKVATSALLHTGGHEGNRDEEGERRGVRRRLPHGGATEGPGGRGRTGRKSSGGHWLPSGEPQSCWWHPASLPSSQGTTHERITPISLAQDAEGLPLLGVLEGQRG